MRRQNAAQNSSGKPGRPGLPPPEQTSPNAKIRFALWVALAAITLAVFLPTIDFDFVNLDDPGYVADNPHLKPFPSTDVILWAFTTGHMYNWHPLTWLSHAVDVALYGLRASGHHSTNLLLHLVNTILLFEILRRMTRAHWRSSIVAALFAIHPLHVESVAWIAERKDVLSAFFFMLTLAAYLGYVRRGGPLRYLLVAICLALGLMAKPMLVTLPLVLLLLDYWPLGRITFSGSGKETRHQAVKLALEKAPLMVIAAASSIVTFLVQNHGGAVMSFEYFSPYARIKNAVMAYVAYLGKTIWPCRLAVFYPHPGDGSPLWQVLPAAILLAGITIFVILQARRRPYLAVGWLWYAGTLVPVIGIVQVGTQSMADRYTYLTLIGIFIAVTWGLAEAAAALRIAKTALAVAACALIAAAAAVAGVQVQHWRNSDTLLRHALRVTSNNAFVHYNLGVDLLDRGRIDEAESHFRATLRIEPRYAKANNNLGSILARKGKIEEAISFFRAAISNQPDYVEAYRNLATAYISLHRPEEAVPLLQRSIELQADDFSDHFELGNALLSMHKEAAAVSAYQRALALHPDLWEARVNLGNAYMQTGQYDFALREYARAIELKPDEPLPYLNMSFVLASQRRWEPAAKALKEVLRLDPGNAAAREDLGKIERFLATQR